MYLSDQDQYISLDSSLIYAAPYQSFTLLDKIYSLQSEFTKALYITKQSLSSIPLPDIIDFISMHIKLLRPSENRAQELREEFNGITTIEKLFHLLQDKFISWFNYEIIVTVVHKFQSRNRSLSRKWNTYGRKLKDYFINSGGLLKDVDAVQFGVPAPPGTRVMIAKVDRDDYTMDDLFFFRRAISKALDIPEMRLYFSRVIIGCLLLEYNIPDFYYSTLFPLSPRQLQQLACIGISKLTCGDYTYKEEEVCSLQ